jgi:hypothetical protein
MFRFFSARNHVSFNRPGTATIFTPMAGIAQLCKTSAPVTITRTVVLTGTTMAVSVANKRGWSPRSSSLSMSESNAKPPWSGYS